MGKSLYTSILLLLLGCGRIHEDTGCTQWTKGYTYYEKKGNEVYQYTCDGTEWVVTPVERPTPAITPLRESDRK